MGVVKTKGGIMKKTALVVLMTVMIGTPCLAQEIEPEGIFSIEETVWQALPIAWQIFPLPWIEFNYDLAFGFYGGEVYPDLQPVDQSFYRDLLVYSIFGTAYSMSNNLGPVTTSAYFGILQPIGIGTVIVSTYQCSPLPLPTISIALLVKAADTWIPPGVE